MMWLVQKPADLEKLVGEIEIDLDDTFTHIDVSTGEVITLTREEVRAAEDKLPLGHFHKCQKENIERAICILEDEHGL
ncbi:hypothetical protein FHS16_005668 [Paenibacillus endophyticus]|uniref:Uncharacterized protein n=1 Tax=Paenibacillus endophyticus TaxID=1294268 RepID=A0A7W5GD46_9BACL|nr:hypothetical protein [Paenibacillus endophyticus]MBB3155560.1 hypothetical protein [Paenibacillus endophyticus]